MKKIGIALLVIVIGAGWALADIKEEPANQESIPKARATGGPDGYGYQFIDSTEAGGPTYSWVDISTSGTALGLSDDGEVNISTSNTYTFYGIGYTTLRVGNNGGILAASSGNLFAGNSALPGVVDGPAILPFWDDLDTETGDVYWEEFSNCPHPQFAGACLVVEWYQRPHFNGIGDATLEVILSATEETMLFQYDDVDFGDPTFDFGASATVGIEDDGQDGTYFLQYSFNSTDLSAGLAILVGTAVPVELMSFSVE